MEKHGEDHSRQDRFSAFWERMAQRYPLPFEDRTLANTRRVLSLVKGRGVDFSRTSILDIGCGTGIYALPMALEAAAVTGLDDSANMIARMTDAMQSGNIQNVQAIKASWKDIDIFERGFEKAFDIAWISMSPAVQTAQGFERMEKCARKWCVYIGWGRKRKNPLMEEIYRLHDIRYGPPPGAGAASEILERSGKPHTMDYFETSWEWKGATEDALEDIVCFIEMQGKRADRELIGNVLDRHERDGQICHTTEVEEVILVWPVDSPASA